MYWAFFNMFILSSKIKDIRGKCMGRPWWLSGWESACQCRGHGFDPWSGKIPHAAEQMGPWATTTEPARLEPVLHNKRGRDSERPAHRDEEWPPLATTRESPHTETKTQHSQKKKKNLVEILFNPVFSKFIWPGNFTSLFVKGHAEELVPQNFYFKGWTLGSSVQLWHWVGGCGSQVGRAVRRASDRNIKTEKDWAWVSLTDAFASLPTEWRERGQKGSP